MAPIRPQDRPWARYLRLSKPEAAELKGLTKEERIALTVKKLESHLEDLTAWMDDRDIPYDDGHIYMDPGLSAWKRGVRRPQWESMMTAAAAGEVGGIGIVAVDRFTRDVSIMEDLIRLAETTDVQIGGPRAGRLDLTTYEGIQQARGMAMQAANESLATSFRIKETLARKMREGKPMGSGRAYGFENGGQTQRPDEVAIIREVAQRMLTGELTAHIVKDLAVRGVVGSRGKPFTQTGLARVMVRPRNAGHVIHKGGIVGTIPGEPILDEATYEALVATVTARRRGRRATGRFLLTGIVVCDQCERTMNGALQGKKKVPAYRCPPQLGGCARSIDAAGVEDMVDRYMIKLLARPDNLAKISEHERRLTDARATQLKKLEEVEEALADLEVKRASGEIIPLAYERAKPVLDKRLARERAKLAGIEHPAGPVPIDAAADWASMLPDEKRMLIKRFRVRIAIGAHRNMPRFDSGRVSIRRIGR